MHLMKILNVAADLTFEIIEFRKISKLKDFENMGCDNFTSSMDQSPSSLPSMSPHMLHGIYLLVSEDPG